MSRELIRYVFREYEQAIGHEIGAALNLSINEIAYVVGRKKLTHRDWRICRDRGNAAPDPAMVSIIRKRIGERGRAAAA
jgi:hypothetical protein